MSKRDPYADRTCRSFEPTPETPEFCAVCGWQRIDHGKAIPKSAAPRSANDD